MKTKTVGLIVAMLLVVLSAAYAEEPIGWGVEVVPYAWLAGIEGTVTVDGQEVDFEKSASDLFDYVEFSAGVSGAVQYNRWVFRTQLDFFTLDTDALNVEDQPEAGRLASDFFLGEFAAGYQIDGWKEGQTYDLLVGMRVLSVANDLEQFGVGSYHKETDLLDPMVAIRGSVPILPSKIAGLRLVAMAGIGGGGDSQLVYEMQPQLEYRVTDKAAARLGYRRTGWQVDSDENDDELDFSLAGVIFGVALRF